MTAAACKCLDAERTVHRQCVDPNSNIPEPEGLSYSRSTGSGLQVRRNIQYDIDSKTKPGTRVPKIFEKIV